MSGDVGGLSANSERKPACPRHGATARNDGSCMVRGCDFDRAVDGALRKTPLTALSVEAQERLEQVNRPASTPTTTPATEPAGLSDEMEA